MERRNPQAQLAAWTSRDEILLYSCRIADTIRSGGDVSVIPEVLAPFPPPLSPLERLWAAGPFTLLDFRTLGDGSWQTNSFLVGGTGKVGMGLLAGSLIGNAAARSRARSAAAADAVPRWVPIDQGMVFASQFGFHMHTPSVLSWSWESVTGANMVAPGAMQFSGESRNGPVSLMLQSDWAELIFITWAMARHPRHPQLVSGGWLPPGWVGHAATHRQSVPARFPGLGPGSP